ncbi:MAG TPA: MMPL family transporter, partial [Candidatus Limnocylindria bacterium]|nr:MMPL family transporter [Candidatus Limnocylindria bacterium]
MFSAWGAFVYRRRRAVALASIAIALLAYPFAGLASGVLSSGGWLVAGSESGQVTERLAAEFDEGRSTLIVLFHADRGEAGSAAVQDRIAAALAGLPEDPRVRGIVGYRESGTDPRFLSHDGRAAYSVVLLEMTDEDSIDHVESLRELIRPQAGLTFELTGYGPLALDANEQAEADLQRAELVSLPLAMLILIVVFASVVAAGMPLLVALLAIPATLGMVYFVGQQMEMSIYVLNVATMLGLALAIDYSLFLVSRFREELRRGLEVGAAVEVAVATAGKAVTFSGIAVAIGLLGLLFFVSPAISSIGIAGSLVVVCSVFYALTFLPAVLGMLGPRVNALSLGAGFARLRRRIGLAPAEVGVRNSRWEQVAHWVMRRPLLVLVPTLILLLAAGTPFLRINQAVPDASVLPAGLESRDAYVYLRDEFAGGAATPFVVLADVAGNPTGVDAIAALNDYADRLATVPGVSAIEGPFRHPALVDPLSGAPLTADGLAAFFNAPPETLPAGAAELRAALERGISGSTVRLEVHTPASPSTSAGLELTRLLREVDPGAGMSAQVGGYIAGNYDTLASMRERTPWAIGMTLLVSAIVLFFLFGSVVLPIKAVFMTLLSIAASFGALVWIFQEGNLHQLFNFEPLGYTVAGNPIIMFAVIFGLSMDYEVLLLSRVQEAYRRTGDNTASVATGLARTAAVITGAALIMVTVFSAFSLADVITIKSIGVGMAIAVFLDATIIRVLLVPATMRLMGRWNWWAPGPLGRLADRLGFSHVDRADAAVGRGQMNPIVERYSA